ncbi:Uncharacterised protein r2_g1114 [Pycnogonum litorale]
MMKDQEIHSSEMPKTILKTTNIVKECIAEENNSDSERFHRFSSESNFYCGLRYILLLSKLVGCCSFSSVSKNPCDLKVKNNFLHTVCRISNVLILFSMLISTIYFVSSIQSTASLNVVCETIFVMCNPILSLIAAVCIHFKGKKFHSCIECIIKSEYNIKPVKYRCYYVSIVLTAYFISSVISYIAYSASMQILIHYGTRCDETSLIWRFFQGTVIYLGLWSLALNTVIIILMSGTKILIILFGYIIWYLYKLFLTLNVRFMENGIKLDGNKFEELIASYKRLSSAIQNMSQYMSPVLLSLISQSIVMLCLSTYILIQSGISLCTVGILLMNLDFLIITVAITEICHLMTAEASRTALVLNELKWDVQDRRSNVKMQKSYEYILLLSKQTSITASGFFSISRSLLGTIISTVVTYVTVLLQLTQK